jgi:4-amino-4-deoxy-L-arabinose transferase-like glycosyltransferase
VSRSNGSYIGLALLVTAVWIATLSVRPLFNTDEGRYAEIPREMRANGDWVVPHLDGLPYVEKPPLQYWASAVSQSVLGENELGARFYTALCALATVLVAALAARRASGPDAGWRAAAVLASMLLFLCMGQLLTLDMSLTFYMTVALAAFLAAQGTAQSAAPTMGQTAVLSAGQAIEETAEALSPSVGRRRLFMLIAWIATALGVLTKGLIAGAIPAAVLICYSLYARDFAPWRRLHLGVGLPVFLIVALPWYWLAARRLPDFLEFFFVHEHFARYLTPSADREQAWWFFGAVFLIGTLPWTLSALRALLRGWRRGAPGGGFDAQLFLRIWVLFVVAFFSVSDSKLIPYILPVLPALALLIAALPVEALGRDVLHTALLTVGTAIALGLLCLYVPAHVVPSVRSPYFLALAKPLGEIAALLAVSGLYVLTQRRGGATRQAVFLGVGWCLSGLLLVRAAAAVAPVYSGIELARALPDGAAGVPLYSVATYDQTLPFYWRRTVTLVAYRGELDYGLRHDPSAELSHEEFRDRWNRGSDAYAIMDFKTFSELAGEGVPMREIARDANRVLAARR